jgi:hypothetical protein
MVTLATFSYEPDNLRWSELLFKATPISRAEFERLRRLAA